MMGFVCPGFLRRNTTALAVAFVFLGGLLVCLRYGRIGFMPLDQSIMFDGGWRILSGQVPFRDFNVPNGLVPMYLQALFFLAAGVNWLAYCLHAAIFNGLFCILAFGVLRTVGGSRPLSAAYAFLSGFVFYPPFGVPYMDQHAFFFILLALFIILRAYRSRELSKKTLYWVLAPPAMLLALFSKQIPTLFAAGFLGALLLITTPKRLIPRMIAVCVVSLAAASAIIVAVALSSGMNFGQAKVSMFDLPYRVGVDRINSASNKYSIWQIIKALFYPHPSNPLAYMPRLFHLIALSVPLILGLALFHRKSRPILQQASLLPEVAKCVVLSLGLLMTGNAFVLLTLNQGENGLAYMFICLGLIHVVYQKILPAGKTFGYSRLVKHALASLLILVAVWDVVQFNDKTNRTRRVHEMELSRQPVHWERMPDGLGFMDFHLSPSYQYIYSRLALMETVQYLKSKKSNFFLIGDSAILYGLARRPSLNPCLWFHPGYSMPDLDTDEFRGYEKKVLSAVRRYKARFLVIEGKQTWFGVSLDSFRELPAMIVPDSPENRCFRQVRILRIDSNRSDLNARETDSPSAFLP